MNSTGEGFKALGSFHYFRKVDIAAFTHALGPNYRFLADSGAFSALTQGAQIKIVDYVAWLKQWKPYITHYINLDVIGDPVATWRNQKTLEQEGLNPIPVFHAGSDFKYLRRYLDEGYTYICLGGLVGRTHKTVMPWAIKCFKEARGKAVFHGLGLTRWADLAALPYYSVDSSSWGSGHRYGRVPLWDDRQGRFISAYLGSADVHGHAKLIRQHGGQATKFSDRTKYTRADVCHVAAVAYRKAEHWLRRRHGLVPIPGEHGGESGLHVYLADTNVDDFREGASGLHLYLADSDHVNLRLAASPISVKNPLL